MKYRSAKPRKTYKSKKTVVKKALRANQSQNIARVVKKVLGRQAEKKVSQSWGTLVPITLQPGVTSLQQNCFTLTPGSVNFTDGCNVIAKGVNQGDRIGDEIQVKGIYFDYQFVPRPYNATSNPNPEPMVIVLYFVQPKVGQAFGTTATSYISNNTTSNFFDADTALESGLYGDLGDMMKRIDSDNYKFIAKREHKLYWSGTSGTGSQTLMYGYNNNDFHFMARGRVKIGPMKCAFNTSNGNPQIQPIYCIAQVLNADGSVAPASHQAVTWTYNNTIYYTDL